MRPLGRTKARIDDSLWINSPRWQALKVIRSQCGKYAAKIVFGTEIRCVLYEYVLFRVGTLLYDVYGRTRYCVWRQSLVLHTSSLNPIIWTNSDKKVEKWMKKQIEKWFSKLKSESIVNPKHDSRCHTNFNIQTRIKSEKALKNGFSKLGSEFNKYKNWAR